MVLLLLLLLLLKWGEKKPKSGGELKSLNLLERGTQKNIGGTQPSQKVERTKMTTPILPWTCKIMPLR